MNTNINLDKKEQIFLSSLNDDSVEQLFLWQNDPELCHKLCKTYRPVTLSETKNWLEKNQNDPNQRIFGIYSQEDSALIGVVRLMFIDWVNRNSELGIFLGDSHHRSKGMGKIALSKILKYAFESLQLKRIYLKVSEENINAIRLYKSLNFQEEGRLRSHFWSKNKFYNLILMGLLVDESL